MRAVLTATALAIAIAIAAPAAAEKFAAPQPAPLPNGRMVLVPSGFAAQGEVLVTINQFNYPGVPDRSACRMQFVITNQTSAPVSFRGVFDTRDGGPDPVNVWVVEAGRIGPNQQAERLFSCKPAPMVALRQPDKWPATCEDQSGCLPKVRVQTNLRLLPTEVTGLGTLAGP